MRLGHTTAFATNQKTINQAIKQLMANHSQEFRPDSPELQALIDHCTEGHISFTLHWNAAIRMFRMEASPTQTKEFKLHWKMDSVGSEPSIVTTRIGGFILVVAQRLHPHKHWQMSVIESAQANPLDATTVEEAKSEAVRELGMRLAKYVTQLRQLSS